MNEGRVRLLLLLDQTRAELVAARIGVSKSAVFGWRSGRRKPSPVLRSRLEVNYRIPAESWTIAAGSTARRVG
ncbi:hypothetical protein ARNL5_00283 [Anaerolineae bacterium]|nr:hypothetical protein ARNL5_00283 [Anaerolineae bacterium]